MCMIEYASLQSNRNIAYNLLYRRIVRPLGDVVLIIFLDHNLGFNVGPSIRLPAASTCLQAMVNLEYMYRL